MSSDHAGRRHGSSRALRCAAGLLALLMQLASCESARGAGDGIDIETLPRLTLREELRIGHAEDPDSGFTSIGDFALHPDGTIYVVDPAAHHVRVYDAGGRRLRTMGRRGQGPGEFTYPASIGFVGDTLWVSDHGLRRITLFSRDGVVLGTFRIPTYIHEVSPGFRVHVMGQTYLGSGRLEGVMFSSDIPRGQLRTTFPFPHLVFDANGDVIDTLVITPMTLGSSGDAVTISGRPFNLPGVYDDSFHATTDSGVFIIDRRFAEHEESARFRVLRVDFDGDTVVAREYRYRPVPFEDWYIDSLAASFSRLNALSRVDTVRLGAAVRRNVRIPRFQPPVGAYRVSQDGGIWLRREANYHSRHRWIVIDADGLPRGQLELPDPRTFPVKWISDDVVWASVKDEMDVPWLVRYRLVRQ